MFQQRKLLPFVCLLLGSTTTWGLPMQVTVNQRSSECLYDTLETGEKVTMSVFILAGSSLKATATLEGPIGPTDIQSGNDLMGAVDGFNRKARKGPGLSVREVLDFEHLLGGDGGEEDDDEPLDRDLPPIDENDPNAEMQRRERRSRQREQYLESKRRKERRRLEKQRKVRQDGEPFQFSDSAPSSGWYRVCVEGTWNQVVAEIEMRKASELGGFDEETGHVYTYEEKNLRGEDEELEKDTASEEGIKDEDFELTREKVKELRRLLNEIQSMQQKERRRLVVHATTNEHSHSSMVLRSLLETLLFMAVTGYQVFTIRRWFSGAPQLGR